MTKPSRLLAWSALVMGMAAITAVVILGLTGHPEAAAAAGAIGAAAVAVGGITVTVNIRR
ncbi:hypothetical protein [Streptomyces lavendofoliae]|nr:hypothetical protein [Streptomyces lavendofoliae]